MVGVLRPAFEKSRLKGKDPWFWSLLRHNGPNSKCGLLALRMGRAVVGHVGAGVEVTKAFQWPRPRQTSRSVRMKKGGADC